MTTKPEPDVMDIPDPVEPRELWLYKAWGYLALLFGSWYAIYWLMAPEYFPHGFFALKDNGWSSLRGYFLMLVFSIATGMVYLAIMSQVEDADNAAKEQFYKERARLDDLRRRAMYPVGGYQKDDEFLTDRTAPIVVSNPSRHTSH